MKKILMRMAVLLVIFAAGFAVYYNTIEEHTDIAKTLATGVSQPALPVISFRVNDNEINQTEGYTQSIDADCPRGSITPLSTEQKFDILINSKQTGVRKLETALLDIPGLNVIESREYTAFGRSGSRQMVETAVGETLSPGREYLLKVILTDSEGRKIYYYTRLEIAGYGNLAGSLDYVENFHACTFDKEKTAELDKYMETEEDRVNNDFSHVDIKDDLDTLSYGTLSVSEVYRYVPTITEYNENFVSVNLRFWVSAYTEEGLETYQCNEGYRFRYSDSRVYLYNYERNMDALFDAAFFDLSRSAYKLGITGGEQPECLYSEKKKHILFSYQGVLWHLDMDTNTLTEVLSYRDSTDHDRQPDPEYEFTLLSVDDEGNADFAVFGRMGKGGYEGRRGILYYHYFAGEDRIEERMYIPINLSLEEIRDEFGKVSYTSEMGIFYFTLLDSYYSYELDTNVLHTEVEDMGDNWLYFEDSNLLVYDANPDPAQNTEIVLKDVKEGNTQIIKADAGKIISILGTVDGRIVYGDAAAENISFFEDGSVNIPYEKLVIADTDGSTVKEYKPGNGLYVCGVEVEPGLISMMRYRMTKKASGNDRAVFEYVDKDVIINLYKAAEKTKQTTSSVNPGTGTEYYFSLPTSYAPEKSAARRIAVTTVVTKDTSAAVIAEKKGRLKVYAYSYELPCENDIGKALSLAYDNAGTVTDEYGRVIWRRSVTESEKKLSEFAGTPATESLGVSNAVLASICAYYGSELNAASCSMAEKPLYLWLKDELDKDVYYTKDATLESMLYFVSDGNPLITKFEGNFVIITAYTGNTVTFYNPLTGDNKKMTKEKAETAFTEAGGVYIVIA